MCGSAACGRCPVRDHWTRSRQRTLSVRRHEAHTALQSAGQREQTEELKEFLRKPFVEGVCVNYGLVVSHVLTFSMWFLQRHSAGADSRAGKRESHHI
jgi:hypothetical protein